MNTWKVILATMVIFAAGVLTGGLLTRQLDRVALSRRSTHVVRPQVFTPGISRLDFLRRVQKELDLSPEQHERADALLKESQERNRKLMEPIGPQLREEIQRTKEQFRAILTPDQQKKFDELVKRAHSRDPRHPSLNQEPVPPVPSLRPTNS